MRKTVLLSLLTASALSFGVAQQTGGGQTGGGQTGGAATEPGVAAQSQTGDTLMLVETRDPGSYIADAEGMTLYALVDETSMEALPCNAECLALWPAYTGTEEVSMGEGTPLDPSLVGTTETEDGQSQVTYNDYPLYYFAEDQNAGDLNGQAQESFGGYWYVLSDTGEPLESDPATE